MPCSAVTLSLATIAAVISVALLAISFSTDNWIRIDVRRNKIKVKHAKILFPNIHTTFSLTRHDPNNNKKVIPLNNHK